MTEREMLVQTKQSLIEKLEETSYIYNQLKEQLSCSKEKL